MGIGYITASRLAKGNSQTKTSFDRFTTIGLAKTFSSDSMVTDSAAGATALATGVKTYNGSIGKSDKNFEADKVSKDLETIVDLALRAGKKVGIITTTGVTHATPASFYAHVDSRGSEANIATFLLNEKISFVLGGGRRFFTNDKKDCLKARTDKRNILKELTAKNWSVVTTKSELFKHKDLETPVLGVFNCDHINFEVDMVKNGQEPKLSEMVEWGVSVMADAPNGYLLIIEGGRIDHAGHMNSVPYLFSEMKSLESALQVAFDKVNPKETLILLTSDHETGGVAINGFRENLTTEKKITFASGPKGKVVMPAAVHTAIDVGVFSRGPGENQFGGFMYNNEIPQRLQKVLDLDEFSDMNKHNKMYTIP